MSKKTCRQLLKKLSNGYKSWVLWCAKRPKLVGSTKFLSIFLLFCYVSYRKLDPDFGWHLKAGDYIFHHWIPVHDIFTYTANQFEWINHEWLNDVIIYGLSSIGGYLFVAIFFAALWTLAIYTVANRARFAIILIASWALIPYLGIRPVVWTVLGLAIIIRLLSNLSVKNYILICLLVLFWVNLHGGFVIGFLAIAIYAIQKHSKRLLVLLLITLFITLLNPYGINIYREIFRTLLDGSLHGQIDEWNFFNIKINGWAYIVLFWSGFLLFSKNKFSNWFNLGPILFVASLSAARNFPLFIIATISTLDDYYSKFKKELPSKINKTSNLIIILFFIALLGWFGFLLSMSNWVYWPDKGYPTKSVQYLSQHECKGNLFNHYDIGGYLVWKLPNQKVYIDGRMPSWRDQDGRKYLIRHNNILGNISWETEFKKYNIKCAIIKNNAMLKEALTYKGWKVVVTEPNNRYILLINPK